MKQHIYIQTLTFLLCTLICFKATASQSINTQEQPLSVESILGLVHQYGTDTVAIKNHLQQLLENPYKQNSIPLLCSYNLLMADVYSIIYDNTNPISDHYYKKANKLLESGNYPELEFISNSRQGHYNFVYRQISRAFPYFLQANFIQAKIDPEKTPTLVEHCIFAAGFYSYIGNQQRAIEYLQIALPFAPAKSRKRIDMLNSISIYYKTSSEDKQAYHYLEESLKEAENAKDSVWIGIISGNISEYKWEEGKREEAIQLLKKNLQMSMRFNELLDAMRCNIDLSTYYIYLKDWRTAEKYAIDATKLMEDKPYFLRFKAEVLKCFADIAYLKGNQSDERKYLKEYIYLKEALDKQVDNEEIKKISWKFEFEKYEKRFLNNELKQKSLKRTYSLVGLSILLLGAVSILLLGRSRHKVKIKNIELEKKQLQLAYEKQILDKELGTVKNSLTEFVETINQNNEIIASLRKELSNTTGVDEAFKNKVTNELNEMLKSHLLTQERWIEFKKNFDLMHPNYLNDLKNENQLLTEYDLRIMALTKLGLSNRSMADLLGISIEGIKKAKQRLKKKISIDNL